MKVKLLFLLLLCATMIGSTIGSTQAATFTVTKLADTNDGNCGGDCSLREAITAANNAAGDDTIDFAPNVEGAINLTGPLPEISSNITITGPGADLLNVRRDTGGNYRIFVIAQGTYVTLEAITISNGRLSGFSTSGQGAGIYNDGGSLLLNNCHVLANFALGGQDELGRVYDGSGGGIYNLSGDLIMRGCVIGGNFAFGNGGGICNQGGSIYISNSIFRQNSADVSPLGVIETERGGAIYNESSDSLSSAVFECTFVANKASDGGAIYNDGLLDVVDSTFTSNQAKQYGGAIYVVGGLVVARSTFDANQAAEGGGISLNFGQVSMETSTLSGNTASKQGGAISAGDTVRLTSCTITQNTAPSAKGGGVFSIGTGTVISQSSIISGNANSDVDYEVQGDFSENPYNSQGFNLIGNGNATDAFNSADIVGVTDPRLFPLANNGGPTKTHLPMMDSPAIDKGFGYGGVDQTGRPFGISATPRNDGRDLADIGSVEFNILLIINDVAVKEGDDGKVYVNFTVTLLARRPETVRVRFVTSDGVAKAPADYEAASGELTFLPGQTKQTITVAIQGDSLSEESEFFRVILFQPENARINKNQGLATILDDDLAPSISIDDVVIKEGNAGEVNANFRLFLSKPSGRRVFITATPFNGSAQKSQDFGGDRTPFIFEPGEVSKTFSVPIKGDLVDEVDENFYVVLSSPYAVRILRGRAMGTIVDDDLPPAIAIEDVSLEEGDSGQKIAAFRLRLSQPSGHPVSVSYRTADGTAKSGDDYQSVTSNLVTFAAGSNTSYARVLINGDTTVEANETLYILLSGATNASISRGRGIGTILNDDSSG